jgi:hypothetical protein
VNAQLEWTWKKAVVTIFGAALQLPEGTEANYENLNQSKIQDPQSWSFTKTGQFLN